MRLVHVRKERGGEVNLELRSPDSASNPYLVFALCLAAGMEGIAKRDAGFPGRTYPGYPENE